MAATDLLLVVHAGRVLAQGKKVPPRNYFEGKIRSAPASLFVLGARKMRARSYMSLVANPVVFGIYVRYLLHCDPMTASFRHSPVRVAAIKSSVCSRVGGGCWRLGWWLAVGGGSLRRVPAVGEQAATSSPRI